MEPDLNADLIRQVMAHLREIRGTVELVRGQVQALEAALTDAKVAPNTLQILHEFSEAGRKLLGVEDALRTNLQLSALRGVNYSALSQQLTSLRTSNDQYEEKYRQLWRSALPIQVQAVLQDQNTTPETLWERRWGAANIKAYQIAQDPAVFSPERLPERLIPERLKEHAAALTLLTLRYADLSLSDVASILGLSVPPVLNSQNALETAIVVELLREAIPCHEGTPDFDNLKYPIPAGFSPRALRYTRLLQVSCGPQSVKILLRVIANEEANAEEDGSSNLGRAEKPDYLAFYLLGKNEFRFLPYTNEPRTLQELIEAGHPDFTGFSAPT